MVRVKVVSKDMGARENGAKAWVALEYSLAHLRTRLQKKTFMSYGAMLGKRH